MKNPPDTIYFTTTERAENETPRVYGPRRFTRMHMRLADARLFLRHHTNREARMYVGTVTWEEVPLDD